MQHQQITGGSEAPERLRGWRATLIAGATPYRGRLKVEGKYRLDAGSGDRKLERRVAEDIDPSLFTLHIAKDDDDGRPGRWIAMAGEFNASRDVEYVVLKDDTGSYRFKIKRA